MSTAASLRFSELTQPYARHLSVNALLIVFSFSLALSTAVTSACSCLLLLIWIFDKEPKARWQYYFSYPLSYPILLLIIISLLGITYSSATWKSTLSSFNHVLRLGLIPMVAFYSQTQSTQTKRWIMLAFISAMLITIVCTCLKVYGHIPIGQRTYGNDVFKNHIVTSYFTAMALFFGLTWFAQFKRYRIANALLISLMLYYLIFLNTGRTGYIILYIGFAVLAWHQYRFKGALAIVLSLSLILMLAYQFSSLFAVRINEFYHELNSFLQGTTVSSIGKRLEFLQNSIQLFFSHPLMGWGTGSFATAYQETFAQHSLFMTDNPHNQYLKIGIELGLVGLFALGWLFYAQWKMTKALSGYRLILAQGLLLSFFIGCAFNSWLDNFSEFYFYCLIGTLLLTKTKPLTAKAPNTYR